MSKYAWHICSFGSVDDLKGKKLTYENVKKIVLEAGRFSVFEATATMKHANIFTRLCQDPEIVTTQMGFPWTGIRLRNKDDEKKEALGDRGEKKAEGKEPLKISRTRPRPSGGGEPVRRRTAKRGRSAGHKDNAG